MLHAYEPVRALCRSEARSRLVKALYEAPGTAFRAEAPQEDDGREVDLGKAPVLRSLLWTGRERKRIPAREVFRHYENNWRQIRNASMGAGEKRLLERLAKDSGRGPING